MGTLLNNFSIYGFYSSSFLAVYVHLYVCAYVCKEKAYRKGLQMTSSLSEASIKSVCSFLLESLEVKGK